MVVEVDIDEETGHSLLVWLTGEYPNLDDLSWFQSQLRRLHDLEDEIIQGAASLESAHERSVIMEYYNGYKEALELVFVYREVHVKPPADYDPFVEAKAKGLAAEGINELVFIRSFS